MYFVCRVCIALKKRVKTAEDKMRKNVVWLAKAKWHAMAFCQQGKHVTHKNYILKIQTKICLHN